jgi:crotonobetaine/carnitine-CoA ligase
VRSLDLPPYESRRIDARLQDLAQAAPDKQFLVFPAEGVEISYGAFYEAARRHGSFFQGSGLRPGDTFGLMLPNCSDWVKCWFGGFLLGCADVGIHHELKGAMLAHQFRRGRPRLLICTNQSAALALDALETLADMPVKTLVISGPAAKPGLSARAQALGIAVTSLEGAANASLLDPEPRDPASLMSVRFTSGTTGPAKAATLTMSQVAVWASYLVQLMDFGPQDRIYAPFPLHHHLASVMGVIGALTAGGTCIVDGHLSARAFWQTATECRATIGLILDPVVRILLGTAPGPFDRLHTIRKFYIGRPNAEFEQRFGARIQTAYALTEANVLAYVPPEAAETLPNCVGYPNPHFEIRIVDERGTPVQSGQRGEIVYRPHFPGTTMESYLDDPASTVAAIRSLWFHTGDLGTLDDAGRLYFFERMGDTIRRRGVNIPSFHIEEAALGFVGVKEAAAVGVPSDVGEFEVKLCIAEDSPGIVSPVALIAYLGKHLPKEMVPRFLEIREDFERTHTQKIIKRALKEEGVTARTLKTDDWLGNRT